MKSINRIISLVAVLSVLTACGPELSPDGKGNNNSSNTESGGSGNGSSANNGKDDSGTDGDSGNAEGSGSSGDSGSTGDTGESGGNSGDNQEVNPDDKFTIAKEFAGGGGSEKNPYLIKTAAQLRKLSADCAKGIHYREVHFRLENDIRFNKNVLDENGELNGIVLKFEQWVPIGKDYSTPFGGYFDGNGHTIYGIVCTTCKNEYIGLFGYVTAKVSNVTIKDSYFSGDTTIGAVVGFGSRVSGEVSNCVNYATVKSSAPCAGVIGRGGRLIDSCANYGAVYSNNRAAGIAAYFDVGSIIINSSNFGAIECKGNWCGGIVASCADDKTMCANNVNFGTISCLASRDLAVGGIVGFCRRSNVFENIVNFGMINKNGGGVGALLGEFYKSSQYGSSVAGAMLCHGYYLINSSYCAVGAEVGNTLPKTDVVSMTAEEMKSKDFLAKLNGNVEELRMKYEDYSFCNWKFGKDGFPVLDWMK